MSEALPTTTANTFNLRSEAFLVAALPVVGSLIALLFEIGFLSFYDVPIFLVQIDFLRIATATAFVVMFVAVMIAAFAAIAAISGGEHPIGRALAYPLVTAVLLSPMLYFSAAAREQWWVFTGLVALLVVTHMLPPVFSKQEKPYLARLEQQLEQDQAARTAHLANNPKSAAFDSKVLAPIGFMVFGFLYVFALGRDHAERRTVYFALQSSPEWILVTAYSDNLIFKDINSRTRVLGTSIRVQKPGDPTTTILVRRNLGRLTPAAVNVQP